MANLPQNTRSWRNWFKYFQYEEDRDSPTEVRNVLLVVATLINALALSALVLVIMSLTCTDARRFPFYQFEIFVATASMILTYGSAIFAVKPKESVRFNYILLAAAGPFVMRYLIKKFKRIKSGVSV